MGQAREPLPVKLIVGFIYGNPELLGEVKDILQREYGPVEAESRVFPFDLTTYYEKEMGGGLLRQFVSFNLLIPPETLPDIKLFTNDLETRYIRAGTEGARQINIDPGYLSLENLILATTKKAGHRPYLQKGIYAELTYCFMRGSFQVLDWTYPDYRLPQTIAFFNQVREAYKRQIRQKKLGIPPT